MAKQYRYIKRVKTKSGKWRYIYDKPKDSESSTRSAPTHDPMYDLNPNYAKMAKAMNTAGKKAKQAYDYTSDKVDTARRKSAVATQKRKLKQEVYEKKRRKANQYVPEDPYKPNKPYTGSSALSARGKKKRKRGDVYVGPADHFTDMNDKVQVHKKRRGSTAKTNHSRG